MVVILPSRFSFYISILADKKHQLLPTTSDEICGEAEANEIYISEHAIVFFLSYIIIMYSFLQTYSSKGGYKYFYYNT